MRARIALIFCCCFLTFPCFAKPTPAVAAGLNQIIHKFDKNLNVGMRIVDLSDNKVLYSRNVDRLYVPASNLKLFTALAAFLELGPGFRFRTSIGTNAHWPAPGTLHGNLYFWFSGDPSLRSMDLDAMVSKLRQMGIEKVDGKVYIDDTAYDKKKLGKGWMWDDLNECFAAPVEAANVDDNCRSLTIYPGKQAGHKAIIVPHTLMSFTPYKNEIETKARSYKNCKISVTSTKQNHYTLKGCIPEGQAREVALAINNPQYFIQQRLGLAFVRAHIQTGTIEFAKRPKKGVRNIYYHYSKQLWQLVARMLKDSNNLYAESLQKKLGAKLSNGVGTWHNGVKAIEKVLTHTVGLNLREAKIVDGSGLSRYDLVSPRQVSELLDYAYRTFSVMPEFVASLPVAGKDGTLSKRMHHSRAYGHVRAKTGSMAGVTSLSGYLVNREHHILSFVILINGFSGHLSKYRGLEDKIAKYLANH